jgi:hypothetical protein
MSQLSNTPQVIGQTLFSTSSVAYHANGELVFSPDGRQFRYCKAGGTTLVPGKLQQSAAEDTTNFQNLAVAAAAIGATSVTTTTTVTLTANQLAGGLMIITTSTGAGYVYRIKSHPAVTTAVVTIALEDPILVALTTSSRIDVHPNLYDGVIVNPATASSTPVGVAIYPVTNAQYGWLQVKGAAPVLADGTVVVGTSVCASNATAGAVEAFTGVQAPVGLAITGGATTEYVQVALNLA